MKSTTEPKNQDNKAKTSTFRSVKINGDMIDFDLSTEHVQNLMSKHPQFYEQINSFNFNIFQFSQTVGRNM